MEYRDEIIQAAGVVAKLPEGTVIRHDEMDAILGISPPVMVQFLGDQSAYDRARKDYEFTRWRLISELRSCIGDIHHIEPFSVWGDGYVIPSPDTQVKHGIARTRKEIHKAIRSGLRTLKNVDTGRVSPEVSKAMTDHQAKWGYIDFINRKGKKGKDYK